MLPTRICLTFRWTILSTLRPLEGIDQEEQQKCYSKIQQLLMDSVLRLKNSESNKHAISAQHLASTTRALSELLNNSNIDAQNPSRDLAMERLAQSVSAAMSANCIYGNKRKFSSITKKCFSKYQFLNFLYIDLQFHFHFILEELLALLQPIAYQHFLIDWTLQTYTSKAA